VGMSGRSRVERVCAKRPVSTRSSVTGKGKRSVHGAGHEADPGTVDSGLLEHGHQPHLSAAHSVLYECAPHYDGRRYCAQRILLIARRSPESDITAESIRELLLDQHPDLAEYPLRLGARGWDNQ